jgi:SAM-dependent methyltransferase
MTDKVETMVRAESTSYEQLASEYYDAERHPTCANFREASAIILREWLRRLLPPQGLVCEVGAGKSLAAELLDEQEPSALRRLLITDASPSMLGYSREWESKGARLTLCESSDLPVADGEVALLVSSLGDPYNEPAFWNEAWRALTPGGLALFTTPSYEWASSFRTSADGEKELAAAFDLFGDGRVFVPSWIYPDDEQRKLIESCGLSVEEATEVRRSALTSRKISPKLLLEDVPDVSVVTGYLVRKPA